MNDHAASHGLIQWHGTTIIGVRRNGRTVIAGDGQIIDTATLTADGSLKLSAGRKTHVIIRPK